MIVATPHSEHCLAGPRGARGRQARPLREAAGGEARRRPLARPPGRRAEAATGHRLQPPFLSAGRRCPGTRRHMVDRPGRERSRRDRAPGERRVPGELAHRRRALRRGHLDGQRAARLRPDSPAPRRGGCRQGLPPPRPDAPPRLRARSLRALPRLRPGSRRAALLVEPADRLSHPGHPGQRRLAAGRDRPLAAFRRAVERAEGTADLSPGAHRRASLSRSVRLRAIARPRDRGVRLPDERTRAARGDRLGRLPRHRDD